MIIKPLLHSFSSIPGAKVNPYLKRHGIVGEESLLHYVRALAASQTGYGTSNLGSAWVAKVLQHCVHRSTG